MTVIGCRPRYSPPLEMLSAEPLKPTFFGALKDEARWLRFAATGHPSNIVENARRTYFDYRYLLDELFGSQNDAGYKRNFRRLAVIDAFSIHRSMRMAFAWSQTLLVVGTAAMGSLLILFVTSMAKPTFSILLIIITFCMVHSVIVLPGLSMNVSPLNSTLRLMLTIWTSATVVAIYFLGVDTILLDWQKVSLSLAGQVGAACVLLTGVTISTMFIVLLFATIMDNVQNRLLIRESPEATIVGELLWVAHILHVVGECPLSTGWRRILVDAIETASCAMERGMPRQVYVKDIYIRALLRERLAAAAQALRKLEEKVLLGAPSERASIRIELVRVVNAIVSQQYSNLNSLDHEEVDRRKELITTVLRSRILLIVRTFILAGLPLVVVAGLELLPLEIPSETRGALTTLAGLWFLVKIVSAADPDYRRTLSDVRGGSDPS